MDSHSEAQALIKIENKPFRKFSGHESPSLDDKRYQVNLHKNFLGLNICKNPEENQNLKAEIDKLKLKETFMQASKDQKLYKESSENLTEEEKTERQNFSYEMLRDKAEQSKKAALTKYDQAIQLFKDYIAKDTDLQQKYEVFMRWESFRDKNDNPCIAVPIEYRNECQRRWDESQKQITETYAAINKIEDNERKNRLQHEIKNSLRSKAYSLDKNEYFVFNGKKLLDAYEAGMSKLCSLNNETVYQGEEEVTKAIANLDEISKTYVESAEKENIVISQTGNVLSEYITPALSGVHDFVGVTFTGGRMGVAERDLEQAEKLHEELAKHINGVAEILEVFTKTDARHSSELNGLLKYIRAQNTIISSGDRNASSLSADAEPKEVIEHFVKNFRKLGKKCLDSTYGSMPFLKLIDRPNDKTSLGYSTPRSRQAASQAHLILLGAQLVAAPIFSHIDDSQRKNNNDQLKNLMNLAKESKNVINSFIHESVFTQENLEAGQELKKTIESQKKEVINKYNNAFMQIGNKAEKNLKNSALNDAMKMQGFDKATIEKMAASALQSPRQIYEYITSPVLSDHTAEKFFNIVDQANKYIDDFIQKLESTSNLEHIPNDDKQFMNDHWKTFLSRHTGVWLPSEAKKGRQEWQNPGDCEKFQPICYKWLKNDISLSLQSIDQLPAIFKDGLQMYLQSSLEIEQSVKACIDEEGFLNKDLLNQVFTGSDVRSQEKFNEQLYKLGSYLKRFTEHVGGIYRNYTQFEQSISDIRAYWYSMGDKDLTEKYKTVKQQHDMYCLNALDINRGITRKGEEERENNRKAKVENYKKESEILLNKINLAKIATDYLYHKKVLNEHTHQLNTVDCQFFQRLHLGEDNNCQKYLKEFLTKYNNYNEKPLKGLQDYISKNEENIKKVQDMSSRHETLLQLHKLNDYIKYYHQEARHSLNNLPEYMREPLPESIFIKSLVKQGQALYQSAIEGYSSDQPVSQDKLQELQRIATSLGKKLSLIEKKNYFVNEMAAENVQLENIEQWLQEASLDSSIREQILSKITEAQETAIKTLVAPPEKRKAKLKVHNECVEALRQKRLEILTPEEKAQEQVLLELQVQVRELDEPSDADKDINDIKDIKEKKQKLYQQCEKLAHKVNPKLEFMYKWSKDPVVGEFFKEFIRQMKNNLDAIYSPFNHVKEFFLYKSMFDTKNLTLQKGNLLSFAKEKRDDNPWYFSKPETVEALNGICKDLKDVNDYMHSFLKEALEMVPQYLDITKRLASLKEYDGSINGSYRLTRLCEKIKEQCKEACDQALKLGQSTDKRDQGERLFHDFAEQAKDLQRIMEYLYLYQFCTANYVDFEGSSKDHTKNCKDVLNGSDLSKITEAASEIQTDLANMQKAIEDGDKRVKDLKSIYDLDSQRKYIANNAGEDQDWDPKLNDKDYKDRQWLENRYRKEFKKKDEECKKLLEQANSHIHGYGYDEQNRKKSCEKEVKQLAEVASELKEKREYFNNNLKTTFNYFKSRFGFNLQIKYGGDGYSWTSPLAASVAQSHTSQFEAALDKALATRTADGLKEFQAKFESLEKDEKGITLAFPVNN